MLTREKIDRVVDEAERFYAALIQLQAHTNSEESASIPASKYTSAVRRASMDLSRALAELRK